MIASTVILLFVLLFVKHFVCDFPLQAFPYMYKNKGTFGHFGGILHAGVHGAGTLAVLVSFVGIKAALILAVFDTLVHYHIDWAKMSINAAYGWKADNSNAFWNLLGLDQLLHYLTYAYMIYWLQG